MQSISSVSSMNYVSRPSVYETTSTNEIDGVSTSENTSESGSSRRIEVYDSLSISDEGMQKYQEMQSASDETSEESLSLENASQEMQRPPGGKMKKAGGGESSEVASADETSDSTVAMIEDSLETDTDDDITTLTESEIMDLVANGDISKSEMEAEFVRRGITV